MNLDIDPFFCARLIKCSLLEEKIVDLYYVWYFVPIGLKTKYKQLRIISCDNMKIYGNKNTKQ